MRCCAGSFVRLTVIGARFILVEGVLQNVDSVVHIRAEKIVQMPDDDIRAVSHDYHHFNSAYTTDAAKKAQIGAPERDLYISSGYLVERKEKQMSLSELMESHDFH